MNRRFLILAPIGVQSGGPEALHQLCDALNKHGQSAFLVPLGRNHSPHPAFSKYSAPILINPKLEPADVVIVPEIVESLPRSFDLKKVGKVFVWWLSVDNASHPVANALEAKSRELESQWNPPSSMHRGRLLSKIRNIFDFENRKIDISKYEALAQSEYAKEFLHERFGIKAMMLGDYLNTEEVNSKFRPNPRPVILYNPFKGSELTRRLISMLPEYEFTPIRGMTKDQVSEALHGADLYLDLGHFPGRDRLARESVIQRCPILIATRGAGRNQIDFALPEDFKVDINSYGPDAVIAKMRRILSDRNSANLQLDNFRREVLEDYSVFMSQVERLVNSISE
jgi:hypothetical protein